MDKEMTAVGWLIDWMGKNQYYIDNTLLEAVEQAKQIEEQRLRDAIMYALDEDGHTGNWKIRFANDYINKLYGE